MQNNIDTQYYQQGYKLIAGADEAGRGAWAGPLVAAAVIMKGTIIPEVNDSKQLSEKQREVLFSQIIEHSICGAVVCIPQEEVDIVGVHQANLQALQIALSNLDIEPEIALVDGFALTHSILTQKIIQGDSNSYSIAAASIIAKVVRDRMMHLLDRIDGRYEYSRHKGYGTKLHQLRLHQFGISVNHRQSFAPIRNLRSLTK